MGTKYETVADIMRERDVLRAKLAAVHKWAAEWYGMGSSDAWREYNSIMGLVTESSVGASPVCYHHNYGVTTAGRVCHDCGYTW